LLFDLNCYPEISGQAGHEQMTAEWEEIVGEFDRIAAANRCDKIRTFGEVHMYACGVRAPVDEPAGAVAACAIEFVSLVKRRNLASRGQWEIRIGLHIGKVTGASIGEESYIYDAFGETVGIAAKMAANAGPMGINVSEAVYRLLRDEFAFQERKSLLIKGKGKLKIYSILDERQVYGAELNDGCRLLSKREAEIVALLSRRLSASQIAKEFSISPRTVERHIANIYEKLHVNSRRELLRKILGQGDAKF